MLASHQGQRSGTPPGGNGGGGVTMDGWYHPDRFSRGTCFTTQWMDSIGGTLHITNCRADRDPAAIPKRRWIAMCVKQIYLNVSHTNLANCIAHCIVK
ncbi:hypothetical protein ANCDUO_13380 [Ancylostoma duodenale]|uniref:Uncharacterized protein n=1 Tax=Ancylostoma duodenale TaxID=51022 RepID=A0A0C2GH93_9BILA|nr:hypothetical protein ANCDUO_13380 [Ancylostoma duodenale]